MDIITGWGTLELRLGGVAGRIFQVDQAGRSIPGRRNRDAEVTWRNWKFCSWLESKTLGLKRRNLRGDFRRCGWRREGPAVKYLVCSPNKLRSYLTGGMPFLSQAQRDQITLLEDGWDVGGRRPTVQFAFVLFQE